MSNSENANPEVTIFLGLQTRVALAALLLVWWGDAAPASVGYSSSDPAQVRSVDAFDGADCGAKISACFATAAGPVQCNVSAKCGSMMTPWKIPAGGYGLQFVDNTVFSTTGNNTIGSNSSLHLGSATLRLSDGANTPILRNANANRLLSVASATRTTGMVTIKTASPHGFNSGVAVLVSGIAPKGLTEWNGQFSPITVTAPDTLTYQQAGADDTGVGGMVAMRGPTDSNITIDANGGRLDGNRRHQSAPAPVVLLESVSNSAIRKVEISHGYSSPYVGAFHCLNCQNVLIDNDTGSDNQHLGFMVALGSKNKWVGGRYNDNPNDSGASDDNSDGDEMNGVEAQNNGASNISWNSTHGTIRNCFASGSTAFHGVTIGHIGFDASYTTVTGCTIRNNQGNGITIQGPATRVTISGNHITGHTNEGRAAIANADVVGSPSYTITKNWLDENYFGLSLGMVSNSTISLNQGLKNRATGLRLANIADSIIDGNLVVNNGQTAGGTYGAAAGIHIIGHGSRGNRLKNNRVYDDQGKQTQQRGILDEGTGDVLEGNTCDQNQSRKCDGDGGGNE